MMGRFQFESVVMSILFGGLRVVWSNNDSEKESSCYNNNIRSTVNPDPYF